MRTRGFTLIELLVVVAIIAILASMLLPSLGRAKLAAKNAICLANQRTIGQAFNLYRTDYLGFYPPGTWIYSWSWDANWCYDENLQYHEYLGTYAVVQNPAGGNWFPQQITGSKVWECPAATNTDYAGCASPTRPGRGYGYNLAWLNYWYTYGGTGYSKPVKVPENAGDPVIVIGDRNLACIFGIMQGCDLGAPANALPSANYESAYVTSLRHGGRTNYLFTDGHVQGLSLSEATNTKLWEWRPSGTIPP